MSKEKSNVHSIHGGPIEMFEPKGKSGNINNNVVEGLEEMMRLARLGHLQSFAATGFFADGMRFTFSASDPAVDGLNDFYKMSGAIACMGQDFMASGNNLSRQLHDIYVPFDEDEGGDPKNVG